MKGGRSTSQPLAPLLSARPLLCRIRIHTEGPRQRHFFWIHLNVQNPREDCMS